MTEHIKGLIAAPFAPMHDDLSLDTGIIPGYRDFLKQNGVAGVFVNGTTGESASLTVDERLCLAEHWVQDAPEGFKVIIHVGTTCLEDSRRLALHAQETGAWGVGAIAPYFFKPADVDDLIEWCMAVASASPQLPFFYYHIPSRSGVRFAMYDFLTRAAPRIPNLAGIKFTYEDLDDYQRCVEFDGGRFSILFGRDEILLSGLERGAQGAVGSTYNFAAPLYHRIIESFRCGNAEDAHVYQQKAAQMIKMVCSIASGIGAMKAAMDLLGLPCGPARLPLRNPTAPEMQGLKTSLTEIGFFDFCCILDSR